ncbi:hypothetical protein EZV73_04175 [Acidaminobacter sp. JC074]|uniref:hypothetical protein n=1 Tax=Acidaminobacter sp. JC074 TaxID=2530199 RepID=UPI001F10B5DC|nr:hypothetical protein [Acidaminobacter sp. JC074]MCH4886749.1 hypothetical protein [Acidaminobacter sp. JC074]
MKIINTFEGILSLADEYKHLDCDYIEIWDKYMSEYPRLRDLCYQDMLEFNQMDYVHRDADYALTSGLDKVKQASENFNKVSFLIKDRFNEFCPYGDQINLYFYMGLSNAAGWATEIDDVGTILIGAEKVVSLDWHGYSQMKNLIAHELAHEAHRLFRGESIDQTFDQPDMASIWQIYIEGFGQRAQQLISDDSNYHQDDGKWLEFCQSNEERLRSLYYELTINNKSTQDFFGDWCKIEGYSDIGYYLGSKWVDRLHETYSFEEIARFDYDKIKQEFIRFFS